MQHIQDKELDQLFKGTFEDAEIAPSANLWASIEQEISPKKKKRAFPILWSVAATIAVVLTVTLVFNKEEKMNLQGTSVVAKENPAIDTTDPEDTFTTITAATVAPVRKQQTVFAVTSATKDEVQKTQEPVVKNEPAPEVFIAQVETPKQPKKIEVVAEQPVTDPVVYTATNNVEQATTEVGNDNGQADRKGIRNVGDLVNYVVDKVDKRDRKAIRFKTEDDESSLIGINIGFLKFNSKKKDR